MTKHHLVDNSFFGKPTKCFILSKNWRNNMLQKKEGIHFRFHKCQNGKSTKMGQNQTYNIKFDNHHLDLSFFSETALCQGTTLDATLGGGEGLARLCGLRPVQKGWNQLCSRRLFLLPAPAFCFFLKRFLIVTFQNEKFNATSNYNMLSPYVSKIHYIYIVHRNVVDSGWKSASKRWWHWWLTCLRDVRSEATQALELHSNWTKTCSCKMEACIYVRPICVGQQSICIYIYSIYTCVWKTHMKYFQVDFLHKAKVLDETSINIRGTSSHFHRFSDLLGGAEFDIRVVWHGLPFTHKTKYPTN